MTTILATPTGPVSRDLMSPRYNQRGQDRATAWNTIGHDARGMTASQAVARYQLEYEFRKYPLYILDDMGQPVEHKGRVGLYREPTPDDPQLRQVATVSPSYEVIQNRDMAQILDPLTERFPLVSAGAINHGQLLFFVLSRGYYEIAGDQVDRYTSLTDYRDTTHSLNWKEFDTRLLCTNMIPGLLYGAAHGGGERGLSLHHEQGMQQRLRLWVQISEILEEQSAKQEQAFRQMARVRIEHPRARAEIVAAAFPEPKVPDFLRQVETERSLNPLVELEQTTQERLEALEAKYELARQQASDLRTITESEYERLARENPAIARTVWAWLNAVIAISNSYSGKSERSIARSVMFGERLGQAKRAAAASQKIVEATLA